MHVLCKYHVCNSRCYKFFIITSILLMDIDLLNLFIPSLFNFGMLYTSRNSFFFKIMAYRILKYVLGILNLIENFRNVHILFLTLLIWGFSHFLWLIWLRVCQPCLCFQRTNSLFHNYFLLFFFHSFKFTNFNSEFGCVFIFCLEMCLVYSLPKTFRFVTQLLV